MQSDWFRQRRLDTTKHSGEPVGRAPEAVERVEEPQSETVPAEPLFEVLAEAPNGHRTVHRVRAGGQDAAVESLDLPDGGCG
jgi:hypothetical protein